MTIHYRTIRRNKKQGCWPTGWISYLRGAPFYANSQTTTLEFLCFSEAQPGFLIILFLIWCPVLYARYVARDTVRLDASILFLTATAKFKRWLQLTVYCFALVSPVNITCTPRVRGPTVSPAHQHNSPGLQLELLQESRLRRYCTTRHDILQRYVLVRVCAGTAAV